MPDSDNPRSYVRPVPLPIPSHQGLKITARNAKIYTCEVPTRREVARENYERRTHQMSKCGYRSVIYKPYQPVGEVYLDDKKLILSALGQEQTEQEDQVWSIVFYIFHWQCWLLQCYRLNAYNKEVSKLNLNIYAFESVFTKSIKLNWLELTVDILNKLASINLSAISFIDKYAIVCDVR